jgi:hypothetical protein
MLVRVQFHEERTLEGLLEIDDDIARDMSPDMLDTYIRGEAVFMSDLDEINSLFSVNSWEIVGDKEADA